MLIPMDAPTGSAADPAPGTLRLRDPRNRVSRKAIGWWTLHAAIGWIVVVAVQLAIALAAPSGPTWLLITGLCSAGIGLVHVLVMPWWRYRVHRWETTPEAVYTLAGWFNLEWRVAPVSRIQTVDTKRGPLEQLFGLSSLTVTTASAAGPVEINGLDHELAARLVEELVARTHAERGDAT